MLKGKNVNVTGSTGGIGFSIARALAQRGCNILFNGLGERTEIEKLVAEPGNPVSALFTLQPT